jgi:hypothetical protein
MCQQKEQLADYRKQFVDKTRRLSGAPTDASLLKHQNNFKTGHKPYLAPPAHSSTSGLMRGFG